MKIRKLAQEEHQNTRRLYEEVFSEDSSSFVDYYYTEKVKDNQIYVVEEDGEIQAMLHLNPYQVMVGGTEKTAHYIVAVATRESYRKRGYMAVLLRQAIHDMHEAGEAFTFLMPAAEAIYLPHGFRTVYEQEQRFFTGESPEKNEDCNYEELREEDCEELARTAETYLAGNYQVYAKRSREYYERLKKECESDGGKLLVCRKDGEITDLRLYENEEKKTEQGKDDKPKIMMRIVDVRRMLMSAALRQLAAFCFQVTDPIVEENNCCLVVTGTEYSGIMLMDGKEENSEGTITVAALSSLLFGARSAEEISREEGVRLSARLCGELGKIVPLNKIYLNEVV